MAGLRLFAILLSVLIGAPAFAQPVPAAPPESVTVTGTKSREVIDSFVSSFAAPTHMTGKIAR